MDSREEKQFHVVAERVIDMICLAISYGLLFLLPETVDFFFYLLFGISAFMFCIGFFRLGFTFNTPADGKGKLLTVLLLILLGAVGNMIERMDTPPDRFLDNFSFIFFTTVLC